MIAPNNNSHVASWLRDCFDEMVDRDVSEDCLSLLNHLDEGIEEQMVWFMRDELGSSGEVIEGDQERLLIKYDESYFSVHIGASYGRSGDALEFDIKRFDTLEDAQEDYSAIV